MQRRATGEGGRGGGVGCVHGGYIGTRAGHTTAFRPREAWLQTEPNAARGAAVACRRGKHLMRPIGPVCARQSTMWPESTSAGPFQDRASDPACADGGCDGFRARRRSGGGGRTWVAACSYAHSRAAPRSRGSIPRTHQGCAQPQFLLSRAPGPPNNAREVAWRERLEPYYRELGVDPAAPIPSSSTGAIRCMRSVRVVEDIQARGGELSFRFAGSRRWSNG